MERKPQIPELKNTPEKFTHVINMSRVKSCRYYDTFEPRHEISNNVVCVTSKVSDQPAHTHSLIRAFASRLNIL